MYQAKTKQTDKNVLEFLEDIAKERKKEDSYKLLALFEEVTQVEPKMWGPSIIGFDSYHYKYASGHEGVAPRLGFAPGKSNHLSLYVLMEENDTQKEILSRLGKHRVGKACLYINKLADIDMDVLKELTEYAWTVMNKKYSK